MFWLESTGGSFVMMDGKYIKNWHGVNASSFANYSSDYEAACDCNSYIETLKSGDYFFIIFNDEPYRTSVIINEYGFLIVRWRWSDEESMIEPLANDSLSLEFIDDNIKFFSETGNVIIFDSSLDGCNTIEKIEFITKSGIYSVSSALYEPDCNTSFLVHRFVFCSAL